MGVNSEEDVTVWWQRGECGRCSGVVWCSVCSVGGCEREWGALWRFSFPQNRILPVFFPPQGMETDDHAAGNEKKIK